jgi:hypothetical protein
MRFYIPNYHIYRNDHQDGHKGGTAVAVKKGIPHTYADLPPLLSVKATGVCIPIGHTEMLLVSVYKSPLRAWRDADITELVNFRTKSILAGDLNAKHPVWNSKASNPSGSESSVESQPVKTRLGGWHDMAASLGPSSVDS